MISATSVLNPSISRIGAIISIIDRVYGFCKKTFFDKFVKNPIKIWIIEIIVPSLIDDRIKAWIGNRKKRGGGPF